MTGHECVDNGSMAAWPASLRGLTARVGPASSLFRRA